MAIKLGTPVRQIVPAPMAGVVVKKQFSETDDAFQYLVVSGDTPEKAAERHDFDVLQAYMHAGVAEATAAGATDRVVEIQAKLAALVTPEAPHSRWFKDGEIEEVADGETQTLSTADVGDAGVLLGS